MKLHAPQPRVSVLAVDLDGTLILTDTLHESLLALLRERPLKILALPFWLLRGKAYLKARIADHVQPDAALLPYNKNFLNWLREERDAGAVLTLCTAADTRIAKAVAEHVGLFDDVNASDRVLNNAAENKRALLDAKYGIGSWDYAGNSSEDLKVWGGARRAIVVNASKSVGKRASMFSSIKVFPPSRPNALSLWRRVLRVHQWLKNLLLFVPLLAAHQIGSLYSLSKLTLAFVAFSLCASAVYIANDLIDLESDRKHPRKRHRPFASAAVSIKTGVSLTPMLVFASFCVGWMVGKPFIVWLAAYFLLTCAYSLVLKRLVLVDCLTLAALYTLRIIAGAAAVSIDLSFWLLAFSLFIFLSLAFLKRFAELQVQANAGNSHAHGRDYAVTDASLVQTLGVTAGYASVLILALYLQGETVAALYSQPELIWITIPLIIFWVSWAWLKAHRGQMHDDPIVFAIKDTASITVAVLMGISFVLATRGVSSQ
jgi:4-hydroxybenzoate polyprenyltransferase